MSVSSAWKSGSFGGLTPPQLELLYEPIILEAALQKAGSLPTYTQESQLSQGYEADMPDLKAFKFFVNKLAQCFKARADRIIFSGLMGKTKEG
ncbi:hypothetical protein ACHAP5_007387 [Fusarium lateritium]